MRKNGYKRRWLCGVLALMSGFVLPGAVQANSGLSDTMQAIDGPNYNYYVGANGASNNAVNVDESVEDAGIIGGYTSPAEGNVKAEYNQVTISGSVNIGGEVAGGYADSASGSAEANDNTVTVDGDAFIDGEIYGGWAYSEGSSARADNNEVNVHGNIEGLYYIAGGYAYAADDAAAENNRVTMNGGTVYADAYGGWASSESGMAKSDNNTVWLSKETEVNGNAVGGLAYGGADGAEANYNNVILDGGIVGEDIYGGYAASGSGSSKANDNQVTMSAGEVNGFIYGGYAKSDSGSAEASNNDVTIIGGMVTENIYGGRAYSGSSSTNTVATAEDNSIFISGRTVKRNIYGGYADSAFGSANASSNRVTVSDSSVGGNIYGGWAESNFGSAYARENSVVVSGHISGTLYGGRVYSSEGRTEAIYNNVIINDGSVDGNIYGGWAISVSGSAEASSNRVMVSGSRVGHNIYGGYADDGKSNVVSNNHVIMRDSIVTGEIYGGHATGGSSTANNNNVMVSGSTINGKIYGGYADIGSTVASDNTVTVSDSMVEGSIYGGYADFRYGKAEAKNNTVILSGMADVSNADLYGSNLNAEKTGNNLVINGWSGAVKSLNNFDQLEVRAVAGGRNLTAGDTISLFTVTNGVDSSFSQNPKGQKVNAQAGVALTVSGNMGISEDNRDIYIDVTGVRVSDQTVIATESRAASVAAVGRGAEAVTDSLDTLRGSEEGLSTFASIIGSRSRYNTGSHADVNGWNGIVGTAWTRELTSGTLSCGAFYENGGGSYDTYNTINGRTYRGDGDTVYNGGGLLLRWETNGGTYTEASLRAGMVKNEVGPSLEFAGNRYGFKTENNYYGGHVGIGRIMERDDGDAWDIYGKYFHMHHEGDTVAIAGDEFAFDSVNSDRLRVGARYLDRKDGRFTGYYGLAYEYEFSGDTGGTANHHAMYTPSLQGSTVIGEIGFRGTPGEDSPWSFEVSLRGYAGKQEGISGAVTAAYSF